MRIMKIGISIFAMSLALTSCKPKEISLPFDSAYNYQQIIDDVEKLHAKVDKRWRQNLDELNLASTSMDFDLNDYFNIFSHIRINQGFALGYVYYDRSSLGGRPIIYHASQEQTPYDDYEAYEKAAGGRATVSRKIVEREFIHAIQTDDVPEAFFELAVFCELAGNFYLYWHDLDVDKIIIVSTGDIEDVFLKTENEHWRIPLTSKQKRRAREIKTFPEVEMGDDVVRVSLTYFKQSGGFYRGNYYFERTFPHRLLKVERENLVLAASQAL